MLSQRQRASNSRAVATDRLRTARLDAIERHGTQRQRALTSRAATDRLRVARLDAMERHKHAWDMRNGSRLRCCPVPDLEQLSGRTGRCLKMSRGSRCNTKAYQKYCPVACGTCKECQTDPYRDQLRYIETFNLRCTRAIHHRGIKIKVAGGSSSADQSLLARMNRGTPVTQFARS